MTGAGSRERRAGASAAPPRGEPRSRPARPSIRVLSLGLAVAAFLVYNANGREAYPTGDSRPTALLPFSILYEGDLDLNEYHPPSAGIGGPIRMEDGRILSNYSPLPALLSLPIYLLAWPHRDEIDGAILRWTPFFSKLAGSTFAALAAAMFFLAAAEVASRRAALLAALVLAFASPFWISASQTLGQHALTVLCGSAALLALCRLERTGSKRWALAAGVACALAVGIRLSNAVLFAAFLLYVAIQHRRAALAFAAPTLAIGVPAVAYLLAIVGGAGGGLEAFAFVGRIRAQLGNPLPEGLLGLLVSPGEGLFVWSPVVTLLLLPVLGRLAGARTAGHARARAADEGRREGRSARAARRDRARGRRGPRARARGAESAGRSRPGEPGGGERREVSVASPPLPPADPRARRLALFSLLVFVAMLALYARYVEWWGGRTYGPRYLTDALPFLLFPAAAALERWIERPAFWAAFVVLFAVSAGVQALGAFRYPCAGDDTDRVRRDEHRVWDWGGTDVELCTRSFRRPAHDFATAGRLLRLTWRELTG
ncbi:MAG: glycosyltransferase family 39 protein [Gemmatimonadota bacterium]